MDKLRLHEVHKLATRYGWTREQIQEDPPLVIYVKDEMQVNVYYTTGTVGTALVHPKRGATQLFRRNCALHHLGAIFLSPRVHLGTGYYEKPR